MCAQPQLPAQTPLALCPPSPPWPAEAGGGLDGMLPWGWEAPGTACWDGQAGVQAQRKESGRSGAEAARRGWSGARGAWGRMPGRPECFFPVLRVTQ